MPACFNYWATCFVAVDANWIRLPFWFARVSVVSYFFWAKLLHGQGILIHLAVRGVTRFSLDASETADISRGASSSKLRLALVSCFLCVPMLGLVLCLSICRRSTQKRLIRKWSMWAQRGVLFTVALGITKLSVMPLEMENASLAFLAGHWECLTCLEQTDLSAASWLKCFTSSCAYTFSVGGQSHNVDQDRSSVPQYCQNDNGHCVRYRAEDVVDTSTKDFFVTTHVMEELQQASDRTLDNEQQHDLRTSGLSSFGKGSSKEHTWIQGVEHYRLSSQALGRADCAVGLDTDEFGEDGRIDSAAVFNTNLLNGRLFGIDGLPFKDLPPSEDGDVLTLTEWLQAAGLHLDKHGVRRNGASLLMIVKLTQEVSLGDSVNYLLSWSKNLPAPKYEVRIVQLPSPSTFIRRSLPGSEAHERIQRTEFGISISAQLSGSLARPNFGKLMDSFALLAGYLGIVTFVFECLWPYLPGLDSYSAQAYIEVSESKRKAVHARRADDGHDEEADGHDEEAEDEEAGDEYVETSSRGLDDFSGRLSLSRSFQSFATCSSQSFASFAGDISPSPIESCNDADEEHEVFCEARTTTARQRRGKQKTKTASASISPIPFVEGVEVNEEPEVTRDFSDKTMTPRRRRGKNKANSGLSPKGKSDNN